MFHVKSCFCDSSRPFSLSINTLETHYGWRALPVYKPKPRAHGLSGARGGMVVTVDGQGTRGNVSRASENRFTGKSASRFQVRDGFDSQTCFPAAWSDFSTSSLSHSFYSPYSAGHFPFSSLCLSWLLSLSL